MILENSHQNVKCWWGEPLMIQFFIFIATQWLTTGKNTKVFSLHISAIKINGVEAVDLFFSNFTKYDLSKCLGQFCKKKKMILHK